MKKSNLLFVLCAFALVGGITGCSTDKPSDSTNNNVTGKHAVVLPTAVDGAFVTASCSQAVTGDDVEITVALTDPTNFELKSVKVGSQTLEGKVDANNKHVFHYSFKMGGEDANVQVETGRIGDLAKDHRITFEGKDLVFALSMPQGGDKGDHISFKLAAQSGYEISSVKVVKVSAAAPAAEEGEGEGTEEGGEEEPKEELVTLSGDPVTGYSFEMPDADVVIKAEALGGYFKLVADDKEVVFTSAVSPSTTRKVSDFVYGYFTESGSVSTQMNAAYFRAGSTVKMVAKRNTYATVNKYMINNVEIHPIDDERYYVYEFTMPASNANVSVEAVDTLVDVEVESEHSTSKIYKMDSENNKVDVTSGMSGEKLYVDLTLSDEEYKNGYRLNEDDYVTAVMRKYNSGEELYTGDYAVSLSEVSGSRTEKSVTYSFITPYTTSSLPAGPIKIYNADYNLHKYKGKEFVNTYFGFKFYGSSSTSTKFVISEDGFVTIGTTKYLITDVDEKTKTITTSNKSVVLNYDDGFIWYVEKGTWSSYVYMAVVADKADDVTCKQYAYITSTNSVVQLFNSEKLVRSVFVQYKDKNYSIITRGITIDLLDDTTDISAKNAKFVVKQNGANIFAVGVGIEYGTYTRGEETLVLDGADKATLNDVDGTYTIKKDVVTITIGETVKTYIVNVFTHSFMEYNAGDKSLYSKFTSDTSVALSLNKDGTGEYNGKTITYTYDDLTKKVKFTSDKVDFELTWDAANGTLTGTSTGASTTNVTFTKDPSPFYVGTFTGKIYHSDYASRNYDCTLTIEEDLTGSYTYDGTTRTLNITTVGVDYSGATTLSGTDSSNREFSIKVYESKNKINFSVNASSYSSDPYFDGDLTKEAE